jgi:NAD(P)-dependent dehydrogenase (short-subunit alcohol dehydrogenase family)
MGSHQTLDQFYLLGKGPIAVLGGEGLLGRVCCDTIRELRGQPISVDIVQTADHVCDLVRNQRYLQKIADSRPYFGVINCVVGNQKPVHVPQAGWNEDIHAGLSAANNAMLAFHSAMRLSQGVYLNIGSDLSLRAPDPQRYGEKYKPVSYSVVKHGIIGLTRYYAALWGREGIRVNCLCPGSIDQGQAVPDCALNRLAQPHELKGAIAWLMSDASSYVTGAIVSVDGGSTI